jgi:hypothetical protein
VGRFEQYKQYGTFNDRLSVNHGELGAQILADYEILAPLTPRERDIVMHSVELHNVFHINGKLPEENRLFLKVVRDADKLDIWKVFADYFSAPPEERASAAGLGLPDAPECSTEILERLEKHEMARLSSAKTLNDFKLMQLSWVYDLNFRSSFSLLVERRLHESIAATLPPTEPVSRAVAAVTDFIGRCSEPEPQNLSSAS